jgi:SAM-dependent methyltransferase
MDSNWSQGYVTEVLYTEHFFRELSPSWLNYVAVQGGCHPRPLTPGFTYLELGCGLGHSVGLLAGAHPQGRFYGVDFNPAHIDSARRFVSTAGIGNVEFIERSFNELTAQDVPECDFIVLHGVYAWVSAEVRAGIQRVILERLKPGGIVYNSYNCLPGWAADSPLQKLVFETARYLPGDATQRTQAALKSVEELVGAKFTYFAGNPAAGKLAAKMAERNANYLAHEFLNEHWTPFYSSDVADEMARAKLTFVGSATLSENHLELLGTDQLQAQVKKQPTTRLKQLFQDMALNQRFRRDVFVRGHGQLGKAAIQHNMAGLAFGAARDLTDVTNVAKVARGEVKFDEKGFAALKEVFAKGTWNVAELRQEMQRHKLPQLDVERTLNLMAATGIIIPCALGARAAPIPAEAKRVKVPSETNRALIKRMADNLIAGNAVSASAGTAIAIDPVHALIITLLQQPWKSRGEAKEKLKQEVQRRRIRFHRGPNEAGKGGAKPGEIKPAEIKAGEIKPGEIKVGEIKVGEIKIGADKLIVVKDGVAQGKVEPPLDEASRAEQYFDKFFAVEGPLLHRLGIIELV